VARYYVMIILLLAATQVWGQRRKIQKTEDDFQTEYTIGLATAFNGISGLEMEMTMKNRNGGTSNSTLSLTGGYSSRYAGFSSPLDTSAAGTKTNKWIHGIGGAVTLNNYFKNPKQGGYWAIGVTGNYYFKKSTVTNVVGNSLVVSQITNLKTFSVLGKIGYKFLLPSRSSLRADIGVGLMGSPFTNSSSSDINGFFVTAGCSLLFKL
jgi:hypothetical protein